MRRFDGKGDGLRSISVLPTPPQKLASSRCRPIYCFMEKTLCWICGRKADSREHIFKSRDLKRIFDRDGREFENLPFHFGHDRPSRISGPKSSSMKYDPSLCSDCNNSKTAQCDRAYDRLSDWFAVSQHNGGCAHLPLAEVFGPNYFAEVEYVRRYFAKSLGCRILAADGG